MSEEVIDTSHQNFCNVVEEMTQSITSVRQQIQDLREKYGLHSLLIVRYDHFTNPTQKRKDVRSRL